MDYLFQSAGFHFACYHVNCYTHECNIEKFCVINFLEIKYFVCLLSLRYEHFAHATLVKTKYSQSMVYC